MMHNIQHHPSEATLLAFASGTLWPAGRLILRAHLAKCSRCRADVGLAEAIGGTLLDGLPPAPLGPNAFGRLMERLDGEHCSTSRELPVGRPDSPGLLVSAAPLAELASARLRWLAPGLRHAVLLRGSEEGTLRLLRAAPGTALPSHTHNGAELTLVIDGAFSDGLSRYSPGDLAEAEEGVFHQPIAEGRVDCVCLIATEGRLRFDGWLYRLFGTLARV
jgi:putative transcriptional regulator